MVVKRGRLTEIKVALPVQTGPADSSRLIWLSLVGLRLRRAQLRFTRSVQYNE